MSFNCDNVINQHIIICAHIKQTSYIISLSQCVNLKL